MFLSKIDTFYLYNDYIQELPDSFTMDQVTQDLPTLMAEKIVKKMIAFMTTIAIILNISPKNVEVVLDMDHPCINRMINNCVNAVLQLTVENLPSHAALHASRCDLIKFMSFEMFGLTVQQLSESMQQFSKSMQQFLESIQQLPESMQQLFESMQQFPESMQQLFEFMQQFPESMQHFSKSMQQFCESMKQFPKSMQQLTESMQQVPEFKISISNYNMIFWEAVEEANTEQNPVEPSSAENALAAPSSEENAN